MTLSEQIGGICRGNPAAIVIASNALVSLTMFISFFAPWYFTQSIQNQAATTVSYDFFDGAEVTIANLTTGYDLETTIAWEDLPYQSLQQVFQISFSFVVISLLLSVLVSVGSIVIKFIPLPTLDFSDEGTGGSQSGLQRFMSEQRKRNVFLILLSITQIVMSFISFMSFLAVTRAINTDYQREYAQQCNESYCGSFSGHDDNNSWGPALGWYLVLLSLPFSIVSIVSSFYLRSSFQYEQIP